MNHLLTVQLLKNLGKKPEELGPEFASLMEAISRTYTYFQDSVAKDTLTTRRGGLSQNSSDKHFRQIVETAQEGIITLDKQNRISLVNESLSRMLGYSEGELRGFEASDIVAEADRQHSHAALARRKQGINEVLEIRLLTKYAKPVWVNMSASPILDIKGNYVGALAMVTDITAKKEQEKLRQKSEDNLRTIFDHADSSYILMDAGLNIISFNKVAQTIINSVLGLELAQGQSIMEFCPPDRVPFIAGVLDKVMAGEAVTYDTYYTLPNGSVRWYEAKWAGVKDAGSLVTGVVFSSIDVTEKMKRLHEYQKATEHLTRRNKDVQEFNYMVSHDLRAPAANIMGLVALLQDESINQFAAQELVEKISVSVQQLDRIINKMTFILEQSEQ